jgi:hypothetical protein
LKPMTPTRHTLPIEGPSPPAISTAGAIDR